MAKSEQGALGGRGLTQGKEAPWASPSRAVRAGSASLLRAAVTAGALEFRSNPLYSSTM